LRENGATGLFMFGSRAVGTERPDSDLDLFIDYEPEAKIPNLFRLMQIEQQMSQALGVPVTITTRNALHPLMKERIERDAIRVS
jgi:predicted nucleotidyltransferase